jgi:hypothetical protein
MFAVLVVGCLNTIIPPLILSIMSAIITYQQRDVETADMTTSLCMDITDPYANLSTSAWDGICKKNSSDLLTNLYVASWIRTGFQVLCYWKKVNRRLHFLRELDGGLGKHMRN